MILGMMAAAALMGAGDPDAIIVTAPEGRGAPPVAVEQPAQDPAPRQSVAHGLTTDAQIEQWIARRREADPGLHFGEIIEDDGKIHGEISVAVGTGDYRDYSGAVSVPVGNGGRLDLQYRQTENDHYSPYDRYYDDGYYGPATLDRMSPLEHRPVGRGADNRPLDRGSRR